MSYSNKPKSSAHAVHRGATGTVQTSMPEKNEPSKQSEPIGSKHSQAGRSQAPLGKQHPAPQGAPHQPSPAKHCGHQGSTVTITTSTFDAPPPSADGPIGPKGSSTTQVSDFSPSFLQAFAQACRKQAASIEAHSPLLIANLAEMSDRGVYIWALRAMAGTTEASRPLRVAVFFCLQNLEERQREAIGRDRVAALHRILVALGEEGIELGGSLTLEVLEAEGFAYQLRGYWHPALEHIREVLHHKGTHYRAHVPSGNIFEES